MLHTLRRPWAAVLPFVLAIPVLAAPTDVAFPRYPAVSPDGAHVAFSWAGDLWITPAAGGVATRLTSHPANELFSAFSPAGDQLAFESDRGGARNLFVLDLTPRGSALVAGQPRRVTTSDRTQNLGGFTPDGSALVFSGFQEASLFRHARMYAAPLDGSPVERLTDAYGTEPRVAPNGDVVFTRGYSIRNRPAYRGPGAMNIWNLAENGTFIKLADYDGNDFDPLPLPGGDIVFVSSRSGQNNIHRLSRTGRGDVVTQLTNFQKAPGVATIGHGVRELAVSADGSIAAFTLWDGLYTLDLNARDAEPRRLTLAASADDDIAETRVHTLSKAVAQSAMHPSGKAVAMVARGEIFVRSTEDDRPARRITTTSSREGDLAWSPDGTTLYFVRDEEDSLGSIYAAEVALAKQDLRPAEVKEESEPDVAPDDAEADSEDEDTKEEEDDDSKDEGPTAGERWAEALTFTVRPVVVTPDWARDPVPSPDGRSLLYVRGLGDLIHVDLSTGAERTVFEGWNAPEVIYAADSRHIIYSVQDLNFNADIFLLDLADDAARPVNLTRHPDIDIAPRLSSDGKVLAFLSDRAGENWDFDVFAVNLDKAIDDKRPYELEQYFKEAAAAAKKLKPLKREEDADTKEATPLTFDAEDAYLRIRRLTSMPGAESELAMTPAGDRIIFEANIDGDRSLYSVDFRGEERKTVVKGAVSNVTVSLTGDKVSLVKGGQAHAVAPTGGDVTTFDFDADIVVDIADEQRQKFREGAGTFGATFYHPTLKGLDWPALMRAYGDLAARTRTASEFNTVFTLLLGEVEGSHTGIRGGDDFDAPGADNGYLGIDTMPTPTGHRVTRVVPGGPSDLRELGLAAGDVITEINEVPLLANGIVRDLHHALAGTTGKETLLTLERDGAPAYALVTPAGFGRENNLRYDDGVRVRRAEVDRLSGGRLGYLHIRGMNLPSVRDFERDLFAAADGKEGLVIDVRDNGGGFTTDILLASLTAPRHSYTVPRGADRADVPLDSYPRDRRLIFGWNRPINVLINENSFSNAEIFAHAIKTTGRGTLVGTQTFGGVISTGGFSLIDGTTIRQPFRGWYLTDDRDMESNGAMPDVPVDQTPEDEAAGRDPQLEAAVVELLGRLD